MLSAAVLLAGCGGDGDKGDGADGASPKTSLPDPVALSEKICKLSLVAAEGKVDEAVDGFHDVHGDLHVMADELTSNDMEREGGARLLRAKQKVEAALEDAPAQELAGDLRALAISVVEAVGGDPPSCM